MTFVTEDDLDELELDAVRTDDHATAAERLTRLAERAEGGEVSRTEILVRAGGQWQIAGDAAKAAELYRRAIDEGGPLYGSGRTPYGDARVDLADALFELGRAEEAQELIEQVRAHRPRSPWVHHQVAELLEAQRDLAGAHEWATDGLQLLLRDEDAPDHLVDMLLRARYRVRHEMGMPEDEYDEMLDDVPPGKERTSRVRGTPPGSRS